MGKLVSINETAQRLGVTEQTIRNWIDKGAISVKKIGKARYIDESTINALQDTAEDIKRQQYALNAIRDEVAKERIEREKERYEEKTATRYQRLIHGLALRTGFYDTVLKLMSAYGTLTVRECTMLKHYLNGMILEEIGDKYGLTRERVRQIVEKAIHKSSDVTQIEDYITEAREIREENQTLKGILKNMKEKIERYEKPISTPITDDEKYKMLVENDELCKLLSKKVIDCDFTVRTLNIMRSFHTASGWYAIETVADLCKTSKLDFLKQRNCGKKTIYEIDDFLETHGLSWDMDIEKIYNDRMKLMF